MTEEKMIKYLDKSMIKYWMILKSLFSIFGVPVLNVSRFDNSPLFLKGIELINVLDTIPGITKKLTKHYKD